jgi:hypothetical protein
MKKVLFFMCSVALTMSTYAQSLDDISGLMQKGKFADAKAAIDKYTGDAKNAKDPFAWYSKAVVNNQFSKDSSIKADVAFAAKSESFEAFKKYQVLIGNKDLKMLGNNYIDYLDLYLGLFNLGGAQYNNKDFAGAYKSYSKAQDIENFIFEKKYEYTEFKLSKLDTTLVMNMGLSSLLRNDTASAVIHYEKLLKANVIEANYESVYTFLTDYYNSKNDITNYNALLAKGRAAYPKNLFWDEYEILALTRAKNYTAMFAKYEEIYSKNPEKTNITNNYSIELYNMLHVKDLNGADIDRKVKIDEAKANKLTELLKYLMKTDNANEINTLMVNHLYGYAQGYSTRASLIKEGKLAKPADIKIKKDLIAQTLAKLDEMIPYAEAGIKYYAAQPTLKTSAKVNYQKLAAYLVEAYNMKGNMKKVAEYEKLKASIKL